MNEVAKGFTLVELLVVISIIAILAVIGLTVYINVQKNARDSRRRADINAIADAMEASYTRTSGYVALDNYMFSQGGIPTDPTDTNAIPDNTCPGVCKYCVRQGSTAQTGGACATTTAKVERLTPSGGLSQYWVVCANLEGGSFYCRGNLQ